MHWRNLCRELPYNQAEDRITTFADLPMTNRKPLRRSRKHRIIAGVCGGLAEWLGWNPTVTRVVFVLVSLLPLLSGILVYILMWLFVPEEEQTAGAD